MPGGLAKLSVVQKGIILVIIPLGFGFMTLGLLGYLLNQAEIETERETVAKKRRSVGNQIATNLFDASRLVSTYLYTRSPGSLKSFQRVQLRGEHLYSEFANLTQDNSAIMESLRQQHKTSRECYALLNQVLKDFGEGGGPIPSRIMVGNKVQRLLGRYNKEAAQTSKLVQELERTEPVSNEVWRTRLSQFLPVAVITNVVISIFLAIFFGTSIANRIRLLKKNAELLSEKKTLLKRLSGRDEIFWLDEAFHTMANNLADIARRERLLTENALDVVCSIDCEGKFVAINPACKTLWDFSPEELLGKPWNDIVHPEDQDFCFSQSIESQLFRVSFSFENRVIHRSGSVVHMMWSVKWSQSQEVYVCIAHCITDRKIAAEVLQESETRLRKIMETMPAMLCLVTQSGAIKIANQTCLDVFGYSYAQVLQAPIGKLLPDLFEPGEDVLEQLIANYLDRPGELVTKKSDGTELPIELFLSEIDWLQERHFIVVLLDIAERHEMETLKRQFVELVGSDLSETIISVHGVLAQLRNGDRSQLNDKGKSHLFRAEKETDRLVSLIEALLDAEKLRAGKVELRIEKSSLRGMVERSIGAVHSLAEKNDIAIRNQVQDINVLCDDARLIQVLVNLLSNAIKYSPEGGIITVSSDLDDTWVRIGVTDQGRGIPSSHIKTIFEEFVQVEEADSKVKGGIGLGLTICRSIMRQHGGEIDVESEEGKTTFYLKLRNTDC